MGEWQAFYTSDWQGLWALLPVPAAFFVFLLVSKRAREVAARSDEARFLHGWSLLFALETLLDPIVAGKLTKVLGLSPGSATAVLLFFVLLGDFRVWWLLFALARGGVRRGAALAAAVTPVIPLLAFAGDRLAGAFVADASGMRIWVLYELLFTSTALWLRGAWLQRQKLEPRQLRFLRFVCGYAALYYGLWAASDLLWITTSLDLAWLLRVVPNQLYYAFFVPCVWLAHSRRA
jgi:hypothetical protein